MTIDIKRELSVVTISTVVVYLSAYFYQYGVLNYFSAPSDFISVDINTLLFSAVLVALILYFIFGPSLIYHDIIKDEISTERQRCVNLLAFYICFSSMYFLVFFGLKKLNVIVGMFGDKGEIIGLLLMSLIWSALSLICTYVFLNSAKSILKGPWKLSRYFLGMNVSPIILLIAFSGGVGYAKKGVADYYYGDDGYFLVTESDKGILVAKCDIDKGVAFKRLEHSFSDIKLNNDKVKKVEIRICIEKFRNK